MPGKSRSVVSRFILLAPLLLCVSGFSQNSGLRITEPAVSKDGTIVTSEPAVTLHGTLSSKGGNQRILWESSRGFSDLATVRLADDGHTALWNTASSIPLRPGINHVRIKALNQPGAMAAVNIFYTAQAPAQSPARARMVFHGKEVTYEVRDGLAIFQSDIILGQNSRASVAPKAKGLRPESLTIAPNFLSSTGLWPVVNGLVRVPYAITNASAANTTNINAAIAESNTQLAGIVQWTPATGSDGNFVSFDFDPNNLSGSCESSVGMVGGRNASANGQRMAETLAAALARSVVVVSGLARGIDAAAHAGALAAYLLKMVIGCVLLATLETTIAKMRVFRVPDFLGIALMLGLLATLLLFVAGHM